MSVRAIRYPLLRWLVAVTALLWLVGGAIEHIAPASSNADTAHAHWSLTTAHSSVVNPDHLRCGDDIALACPFLTTVADMTSWTNAPLALGAVCAFVAAICGVGRDGHGGLRAPPHGGAVLAGRDLLTRLCVTRR